MVTTTAQATEFVPGLDARALLRWQRLPRAQSPWLHEEVATRMLERLQWFRVQPDSWLHWEPLLGGLQAHQALCARLHAARCHVAAQQMASTLVALRAATPRWTNSLQWLRGRRPVPVAADTRVDMLWANMALHLEPAPQALLRRWHGQIENQGFLLFSCLGPDTLRELRDLYQALGWPAPTQPFTDMHDWGDMLVHTGFAQPVMDMERISLSYSAAAPLLADLRLLGRNFHPDRFPALRARGWHARLAQALESELPRTADGRLLLSVEVIYGHAFKPAPSMPLADPARISVAHMRAMLRAGRG